MSDIKKALNALLSRKIKVDINGIEGTYIVPLTNEASMEIIADIQDKDNAVVHKEYHRETIRRCFVNEKREPIFDKDEFTDFYNKADESVLAPILEGIRGINSFHGLDEDAKKK